MVYPLWVIIMAVLLILGCFVQLILLPSWGVKLFYSVWVVSNLSWSHGMQSMLGKAFLYVFRDIF